MVRRSDIRRWLRLGTHYLVTRFEMNNKFRMESVVEKGSPHRALTAVEYPQFAELCASRS